MLASSRAFVINQFGLSGERTQAGRLAGWFDSVVGVWCSAVQLLQPSLEMPATRGTSLPAACSPCLAPPAVCFIHVLPRLGPLSLAPYLRAAFVWEDGGYRAKTFNFYIFPRPFEGSDKRFVCQAS